MNANYTVGAPDWDKMEDLTWNDAKQVLLIPLYKVAQEKGPQMVAQKKRTQRIDGPIKKDRKNFDASKKLTVQKKKTQMLGIP